jgi:hypothetical protein
MTFKEKSAAVTLLGLLLVYGGYFSRAWRWSPDTPMAVVSAALIGTVVSLVVLLIVMHIVVAAFDRKAKEDERDRLIELIGDRNGGYAIGAGAFIAMLMLLGELPAVRVIHVLLGAMVLSEIVKIVTQLWLYRRGI